MVYNDFFILCTCKASIEQTWSVGVNRHTQRLLFVNIWDENQVGTENILPASVCSSENSHDCTLNCVSDTVPHSIPSTQAFDVVIYPDYSTISLGRLICFTINHLDTALPVFRWSPTNGRGGRHCVGD